MDPNHHGHTVSEEKWIPREKAGKGRGGKVLTTPTGPKLAQELARKPQRFTEMDVAPQAKEGADEGQGQQHGPSGP